MLNKKRNKVIFLIYIFIFISILFSDTSNNINAVTNNVMDLNKKKVLYLTFDDGPSIITNKLLDTLKQCNVKATFFVVGKEIIGREDMLKRIYTEGHSIGLHTYSHDFKKIYKSPEAFIKEMKDTNELVVKLTGSSTNLVRFPGGSSKHLNENLLEKLHENNFKVYDWDSSLEDGVNGDLSIDQLFCNSKKHSNKYCNIILLMHCNSNNLNTVKALPKIIEYYRACGYELRPISKDTPEYYYKIKKHSH